MSFCEPGDSQFTRLYSHEVEMVLSAMDCLLATRRAEDHVIYCSSELTTGSTLYETLRQRNLRDVAQLKAALGDAWFHEHIFQHNAKAAIRFAQQVKGACGADTFVITPAPFAASDWSQFEYLAFWKNLLQTRVTRIWFNRNWQYSNGCTFELAVALEAGIPIADEHGKTLERETALGLVAEAITELRAGHFDTAKLEEALEAITIPTSER